MKMKIGIISIVVSILLYITVKMGAAIVFAGTNASVGNTILYGEIIGMFFTDLCVLCVLTLITGIVLIVWHLR